MPTYEPTMVSGYVTKAGRFVAPHMKPHEAFRRCEITPRGHREVLLQRIEAARREGRGVR